MNTECKYYWEDCCTKVLENEMIYLDVNGKCNSFELGISDYYNNK